MNATFESTTTVNKDVAYRDVLMEDLTRIDRQALEIRRFSLTGIINLYSERDMGFLSYPVPCPIPLCPVPCVGTPDNRDS